MEFALNLVFSRLGRFKEVEMRPMPGLVRLVWVSKEGNSPFTYIIVDNEKKTRTRIHTPGYPPMVPTDISQSSLVSAPEEARVVYFDGRLLETALIVPQEEWTRAPSIASSLVSMMLRLPKLKFAIVTLGEERMRNAKE
ncbi:hypothetical protein CRG98_002835 [Punica granatum]|uniref:Uncharacterized protein n=1 Tax=Punica granatum TaxID=22663 RepID=A0A2I0L816_PUNGR|nr:hypothetical protein CRG98_002835 [Punica granatum]